MRFQTAAIVAALATGAISGPTAHLKHMQMHAARDAQSMYALLPLLRHFAIALTQ